MKAPYRLCMTLFIGLAFAPVLAEPQITFLETPGNLTAFNPLGCVAATSVQNGSTAADIATGARACADAGNYDEAAELVMVASAYAFFDTLRVTDKSAHIALTALFVDRFGGLAEAQEKEIFTAIEVLTDNGDRHHKLCTVLRRVGPPNYRPTYMIAHGLQPFLNDSDEPAVRKIDTSEGWEKALSYVNCPVDPG